MADFKVPRLAPPFGPDYPVGLDCSADAGRTKQSFAEESNINSIMAKFHITGVLVDPKITSDRQAFFGDVSGIGDYQAMKNKVLESEVHFGNLPSAIRTRFGNKPNELVKFLEDPANKEEAIKLGIVNPPPEPPEEPVAPVPPAAPPEPPA